MPNNTQPYMGLLNTERDITISQCGHGELLCWRISNNVTNLEHGHIIAAISNSCSQVVCVTFYKDFIKIFLLDFFKPTFDHPDELTLLYGGESACDHSVAPPGQQLESVPALLVFVQAGHTLAVYDQTGAGQGITSAGAGPVTLHQLPYQGGHVPGVTVVTQIWPKCNKINNP